MRIVLSKYWGVGGFFCKSQYSNIITKWQCITPKEKRHSCSMTAVNSQDTAYVISCSKLQQLFTMSAQALLFTLVCKKLGLCEQVLITNF